VRQRGGIIFRKISRKHIVNLLIIFTFVAKLK